MQIMDFIDQNIADYPNLVSKQTLATTLEGSDVVMATISTGNSSSKPIMFYECGIHAREWISPATCMWIMNEVNLIIIISVRSVFCEYSLTIIDKL